MARSIWKGSINFGMVSIPAKVYTATEDAKVNLHQYHAECSTRIQMPKYCPTCERHLQAEEIVKGYDTGSRVVTITGEDFERLPLRSIKAIEVVEFISPDELDIRCFDSSYFISPESTGNKAYRLFLMAMEAAGVAAVSKFAYREREKLCVIRPFNGVMLLQTLLYADQLRPVDEYRPSESVQQRLGDTGTTPITEKEIEMAKLLVQTMVNPEFSLASYQDDYRVAIERLIEAKLMGEELEALEEPIPSPGDVADQLLASLQAAGVKV
jgi:DNA end-binding protein Ku